MLINKEIIESLFSLNLSEDITELIDSLELGYKYLDLADRDDHILKCIQHISEEFIPSGELRKPIWQKGWDENYTAFINGDLDTNDLLPHYYRRGKSIMRLQGKYIFPNDDYFEAKFLSIIQAILAENFLDKYQNIYELGAGPCHNVISFAKKLKNKNFYVTDWVDPTIKIIKHIEQNKKALGFNSHSFDGRIFNYFNIDKQFIIEEGSVVITWGSMEQIGTQYEELLKFFLSQPNVDFIHIEPTLELYSNNLFDQLALQYSIKRNYLNGYFTELFKLESENKINITYKKRIIGSAYHDGWSIVCWGKNNTTHN
tara:strand:- start:882 stop:1823 length:942 start_codon:yes stop_codon:yes gene_type:complete